MNPFTFIAAALGLVPQVVDAVRSIVGAAHKPPKSISRKHSWRLYLEDPPTCMWCGVAMTKLNANDWCPEFEPKKT